MQVLTLPDGQTHIEVNTTYSSAVQLIARDVSASGGVLSVTSTVESGIFVDNTDPANPLIFNNGVIDITVDAPLTLTGGAQHPEIGIDTTALGGTGARANKNMAASAASVDGAQACATAVTTTPFSGSAAGGYFGVDLNGVNQVVGDGTKVSVPFYMSGDGGTTARAMKSIVAGDKLYVNVSVLGFNLGTTDVFDFFYQVTT